LKRKSKVTKVTKAKAISHSLTKLQKAEVKKLIAVPVETKYVATAYQTDYGVKFGVDTPTDCQPFLPTLTQGITDSTRVADQVHPTRARGFFTFWLDPNVTTPVDLQVNLMVLMSKVSPGVQTFGNLSFATLLQKGDGTYMDPSGAQAYNFLTQYNNMPVNTQNWHLLKHKTFRVTRNAGSGNTLAATNFIASNGANHGGAFHRCVVSFTKGIKNLKYLNPTDSQPTSHYPVWLVWATPVDCQNFIPYNPGTPPAPNRSVLRMGFRSDMSFKDS